MPDQDDIQTPEISSAFDRACEDFAGGNFSDTEPVFKRALQELSGDVKTTEICLQNLSRICAKRFDYNEAIRLRMRLLLLHKSQRKPSDEIVASMEDLAKLYELAGRYEEAGDLYYRAKLVQEQLVWSEEKDEGDEIELLDHGPLNLVNEDSLKAAFESTLGIKRHALDPTAKPGTTGEGKVIYVDQENPRDLLQNEIPVPTASQANLAALLRQQAAEVKELQTSGKFRKTTREEDDPKLFMQEELPKESGIRSLLPRQRNDAGPDVSLPFQKKPPLLEPLFKFMRVNFVEPKTTGSFRSELTSKPADTISESAHRIRVLSSSKEGKVEVAGIWQHVAGLIKSLTPRQLFWKVAKVTKPVTDDPKAKGQILAGSAVLVTVLMCALLGWGLSLPTKQQPIESYLSMPHTYISVDGEEVLKILNQDRCELTVGSQTLEATLFYYNGDWREAANLAFRSIFQRELWMIEHADMLVDDDRTELFSLNSRTVAVTDRMRLLNTWANTWYGKHGRYPESSRELLTEQSPELIYDNPYTQSQEAEPPVVQTLTLPAVATAHDANDTLNSIFDLLHKGGKWKDEGDLAGGVIKCCFLRIPYGQGTLDAFLVHSASEDGQPFLVNDNGDRYFVASSNGKSSDTNRQKMLPGIRSPVPERIVWLIQSTDSLRTLLVLRRTGAIIFGFISALLFTVLCGRRQRAIKILALVGMCFTLAIAVAYFMQNQLP